MNSVNKVTLIGNLGRDPEIRMTSSGTKVANITVATSDTWTDKSGERQERTEWHRVVIWGAPSGDGLAGIAEKYLHKGSKVYLCGKLETRKWQGQDGQDRYTTEVVLRGFSAEMVMLDGKDGAREPQPRREAPADLDDEIPF